MDNFNSIRRILTISLAGALMLSAASRPETVSPEKQCFLFPQFLSAAAASREQANEDKTEAEITYTFGFLELLKAVHK